MISWGHKSRIFISLGKLEGNKKNPLGIAMIFQTNRLVFDYAI